jgi:hypothetical protein
VATHLSNHDVGVIVLIPQSFTVTDEKKSMYLAFRDEMRSQIAWERTIITIIIGWNPMDHFSGDSEMLTMMIIGDDDSDEEHRKDFAIEGPIQRQKYNEAFHVATG